MNIESQEIKILVVDDNLTNLKVITQILKELGVTIISIDNGAEAIELAEKHIPHMVLLDIMMPDIDGYEVCRRLKQNPILKNVPVIFLTAKVDSDNIVFAFNAGAVDYIAKPFNPQELLARVRNHLDLKLYQENLKFANQELERLNQEKNDFLGIVAHDLKNPIYNISMIAKTIKSDENMAREELLEFTDDIITSSDRMVQLISNLLDINNIESVGLKLNFENVNLEELLQELVNYYQEIALNKQIKIFVNFSDNNCEAYVDKNCTFQIFDNLLSNAIKYSPLGKNVFINVINQDSNIRVEFKDEGQGISEEELPKLFGKYVKLSARPTANENSTGLGLSIVKKYAEAMQAKVWCESTYGEGANFIVEFAK